MNIEQKNTLFVVTLVLVVLLAVGSLVQYLINAHVTKETAAKLKVAREVYIQAQDNAFRNLFTRARAMEAQPALQAATMTRDMATIKGMLQDLVPETGMDLVAVYLGKNASRISGHSQVGHLSAPKVLTSNNFLRLVEQVNQTQRPALGYHLVFDQLLRVTVIPIRNPLGLEVGSLLVGEQVSGDEALLLRELIRTEVFIYRDNLVLGSSFEQQAPNADLLRAGQQGDRVSYELNGQRYQGVQFPIFAYRGGPEVATVTLSLAKDDVWSPYRLLTRNGLYASLVIVLFAVLIGIYISRYTLTRPIKQLVDATNAISLGDWDVRVKAAHRNDELGILAQSFNGMLDKLKHSQIEEQASRERFHHFAQSSSDWLWETDAQGRFTYVSGSVTETLNYRSDEMTGKTMQEIFDQDNMARIMGLLQPKEDKLYRLKDVELWLTSAEGVRRCLRISAVPYLEAGKFCGFRGTARDITQAKNDEQQLVRLANKDHLTGLSNRRRFMEDLNREINVAERQKTQGALLLIDLDHFKLVNDTAGHAAGDEVIVQVASLLRRTARGTDLTARLSGDEFVLAFVNTDVSQVMRRAEQIVKAIGQLKPTYGGRILNCSASVGVVLFPKHGSNALELLAKADTAMYAAKKQGRNRAYLYSEHDMAEEVMGTQLAWKDRIVEALEHKRFELAFQPIFSCQKNDITRYEVLIRMRSSDGKLHKPGSFVPTAEQFGLVQDIDRFMVSESIRTLNQVLKHQPYMSFSVNLSGLSVGEEKILRVIEKEVSAFEHDPDRIIFEITESAAFQDINRANRFIRRIQEMGCRLALDDFGVGFSSFSYLKHLQADILKIDGSFIRDIHHNEDDQLFVKALVDVARGMRMTTVAEFVETAECMDIVRKLGVDYIQGYYIGKPEIGLFEANAAEVSSL